MLPMVGNGQRTATIVGSCDAAHVSGQVGGFFG